MWETRLKVAGYPPTPQGLEQLIHAELKAKWAAENAAEEIKGLKAKVAELSRAKSEAENRWHTAQAELENTTTALSHCWEEMRTYEEKLESLQKAQCNLETDLRVAKKKADCLEEHVSSAHDQVKDMEYDAAHKAKAIRGHVDKLADRLHIKLDR